MGQGCTLSPVNIPLDGVSHSLFNELRLTVVIFIYPVYHGIITYSKTYLSVVMDSRRI